MPCYTSHLQVLSHACLGAPIWARADLCHVYLHRPPLRSTAFKPPSKESSFMSFLLLKASTRIKNLCNCSHWLNLFKSGRQFDSEKHCSFTTFKQQKKER